MAEIGTKLVAKGFKRPVWAGVPEGTEGKLWVMEQEGRVWIVDLSNNTLVYSPGYVVSQSAADFAIANPVDPVNAEGDVVVGYVLPQDVVISEVPEDPYYGYVYIDGRPALVESASRTIVWVE